MVLPACSTWVLPASTRSTDESISALISLAAPALRCASARTSPATTAKPGACSPARAASTAALSARMLVWKAMPSITPMMSTIFCELVLMSLMVCTTPHHLAAAAGRGPPRRAPGALARLALSALLPTVEVSSSMLAAVCSSADDCSSVREDRSVFPAAISSRAGGHGIGTRAHLACTVLGQAGAHAGQRVQQLANLVAAGRRHGHGCRSPSATRMISWQVRVERAATSPGAAPCAPPRSAAPTPPGQSPPAPARDGSAAAARGHGLVVVYPVRRMSGSAPRRPSTCAGGGDVLVVDRRVGRRISAAQRLERALHVQPYGRGPRR